MILIYRWIPDIKTLREAVFSGHFGPIGVGAVFISTLAATKLPIPHDPPEGQLDILATAIEPIVAFMVLCSIAVRE
jgi:NhaP-type Na+/H+ or K+/H+ antiporter